MCASFAKTSAELNLPFVPGNKKPINLQQKVNLKGQFRRNFTLILRLVLLKSAERVSIQAVGLCHEGFETPKILYCELRGLHSIVINHRTAKKQVKAILFPRLLFSRIPVKFGFF